MTELKPCPFCGGEPTAIETHPGRGELYCGNCDVVMGGDNAMTPEELTAAWNTRAERTCHAELNEECNVVVCSECGSSMLLADWGEFKDWDGTTRIATFKTYPCCSTG